MNFLKKNKTIISILIGFILALLLFWQCNKQKELKSEKKKLKQKIAQNKAALKDSSAVIETQKNEIFLYSNKLQKAYNKIDSLKNVDPEKVTIIDVKYKDTNSKTVPNKITLNNDKTGTKFSFNDKIMSFKGISFFKTQQINDSLHIKSDSTKIHNRTLNFGIGTYQYRNNSILKVGAKPYRIKENGEFGKELNEINLQTRSAKIKTKNTKDIKINKYVPTISIGGGPIYPIASDKNFGIGVGLYIGYGRRLDK